MPRTHQWEIQNSMFQKCQYTVFSFLRAENMVRVVERLELSGVNRTMLKNKQNKSSTIGENY